MGYENVAICDNCGKEERVKQGANPADWALRAETIFRKEGEPESTSRLLCDECRRGGSKK